MKKQYSILFVLTLCFCIIYLIGFHWENQFPDARQYGGPFVLSFVPVFLFYLVFYGCFSYVKTKKLIIPNCLLLFSLLLFFLCWTFIRIGFPKMILLSNLFKCLAASFISVGLSLSFGLLTKFMYYLRKKHADEQSSIDSIIETQGNVSPNNIKKNAVIKKLNSKPFVPKEDCCNPDPSIEFYTGKFPHGGTLLAKFYVDKKGKACSKSVASACIQREMVGHTIVWQEKQSYDGKQSGSPPA